VEAAVGKLAKAIAKIFNPGAEKAVKAAQKAQKAQAAELAEQKRKQDAVQQGQRRAGGGAGGGFLGYVDDELKGLLG
jgi:hypothetical protein